MKYAIREKIFFSKLDMAKNILIKQHKIDHEMWSPKGFTFNLIIIGHQLIDIVLVLSFAKKYK